MEVWLRKMLKIYRYTTNQYLEQWYEDGDTHWMVFQPVSRYEKIENDIRRDSLEGVAYFMPDETEIMIGDMLFPAWDIRTGMAVENFMIACFSTVYSKELCERFNADCVLEGEIDSDISSYTFSVLNGEAKEIIKVSLGYVNYDSKITTNLQQFTPQTQFAKTLFTKSPEYAIECEFRFVTEIPQSMLGDNKLETYSKLPLKYSPIKQWKLLPKL